MRVGSGPSTPQATTYRGDFNLKYKDQAFADFAKAVEIAPSSALAHVNRGYMYHVSRPQGQ
jgi:Tfp pilus assembly protein PilF